MNTDYEGILKSSLSDNEIMEQVRDGNVKKLGELFERHADNLYRFLARHTNSPDASEDLVQDVFFRMLKYRLTFRGDAPFTVWKYQLARNAANDYFKKWKKEFPVNELPDESEDSTNAAMNRKEETAFLQLALNKLSAEKREVLLLSRFQELKYEQIGKILQCPVGTVKARVHFALRDLREEYFKLTGERTA